MNPYGHVPDLSDEQIREMARAAERVNDSLPTADRRPKGWHFRRAAVRLGVVPLPDVSVEELISLFEDRIGRVRGA